MSFFDDLSGDFSGLTDFLNGDQNPIDYAGEGAFQDNAYGDYGNSNSSPGGSIFGSDSPLTFGSSSGSIPASNAFGSSGGNSGGLGGIFGGIAQLGSSLVQGIAGAAGGLGGSLGNLVNGLTGQSQTQGYQNPSNYNQAGTNTTATNSSTLLLVGAAVVAVILLTRHGGK